MMQIFESVFQKYPHADSLARIFSSAFQSIEPAPIIKKYLQENQLPSDKKIFAFGLGKAAIGMTQALADEILLVDSLIITKHASALTFQPVSIFLGNHPIPGDSSLRAGMAVKKFLSQITKDDLLICLISGGGSALMTLPVIPLEDLQTLTSALLKCGARVDEINTLRRHVDELKGGGLVQFANGAQIISLLLSDVVGDSLEAIASGPAAPDSTTKADALAILEKYQLKNKIPDSVFSNLQETLKPNDSAFDTVQNILIGSNRMALQSAEKQARLEGFHTKILNNELQGEASFVGGEIAKQFKDSLQTLQRPFCLLAGGETTVTVKGNGKGGRNQELALSTVEELAGLKDVMFISIATDGEDGSTDAAGAVVTGETAQRAELLGLDVADYKSRNDAYHFFAKLNDLIKTNPSGTNVNDLILCFAF